MKKVAFGRCALPHPGHVFLINTVDIFILSNSQKLPSPSLRISLLKELGADVSKVVVGNPYKELAKIKETTKAMVVSEEANVGLAKAVGLKTVSLNKVGGLSSTLIKNLFSTNAPQLNNIYKTKKSLGLASLLYNQLQKK